MATKRMPTGLVIRDRSIKIWFMYRGKRCWESLPLKPTTANIRHATKLREEVCTRIAIGVFDYAEFFPDSKRAEETERSPSFREMAEAWLSTVNQLSHSTLSRYRGMLNSHVLPKIGDIPIDRIQYSTLAGLLATLERVHSLRSRTPKKAKATICRLVLNLRSQFFQSRLFFSNQEKLRSTTHRFGNTAKRCNSFRLAISTSAPINSCTDEANALPV